MVSVSLLGQPVYQAPLVRLHAPYSLTTSFPAWLHDGGTVTYDDEQRQLQAIRSDLVREFEGRLTAEEVQERFAAIVADFEGAPVRTFVPVLVQRRARAEMVRRA